jgi:hypothetical protein
MHFADRRRIFTKIPRKPCACCRRATQGFAFAVDCGIVLKQERSMTKTLLQNFFYNPYFWDRKMKIAVLTLATFVALC